MESKIKNKPIYKKVLNYGCSFRQYGDEERICTKCGYVISSKGNVNESLEFMINNGYEVPNCGVNNFLEP